MATLRKIGEQETVKIVKKKMAIKDDRLSDLPESLQLHILASLDHIQHAIQTSMLLSTSWRSMWTRIPVLEFYFFYFNDLRVFDKFVYNVLLHRDHSAKLERLLFCRSKICSAKILKKVFDYAFLYGVKHLRVSIKESRNNTWPICPLGSFDSLRSLNLQSQSNMSCPYMGPMSRSFKNLTSLHLKHVLITDHDPFSWFPVLESLTLRNCHLCLQSSSETLSIHSLRLSRLTMSSLQNTNCCELATPRLRFLDYRGFSFLLLQTHEGLPDLESVEIDFYGACYTQREEKLMFDDLMAMLFTLRNVKSLTLFFSIVQLLSFFPDELMEKRITSPFRELKNLKMDFGHLYCQNFFNRPRKMPSDETFEVPLEVKAYLLHNSPDANFTFTCPGIRCLDRKTSCYRYSPVNI